MADVATVPRQDARATAPRPFIGRRAVTRYVQTILAPPERVFPLICPVREAEWADGWVCEPVFAASGLAEENGVYATHHEGERAPTLWVITKRDAETHETEFVYFAPGLQIARLKVAIEPGAPGTSRVFIEYVRTGVSDEGNAVVARMADAATFEAAMKEWETALNHYLATGVCLRATSG